MGAPDDNKNVCACARAEWFPTRVFTYLLTIGRFYDLFPQLITPVLWEAKIETCISLLNVSKTSPHAETVVSCSLHICISRKGEQRKQVTQNGRRPLERIALTILCFYRNGSGTKGKIYNHCMRATSLRQKKKTRDESSLLKRETK